MTYIADLAEPGNVKSVGYLARGRNYNQGEVSEEAFDRLVKRSNSTSWNGGVITSVTSLRHGST
jgi:hypothetical protein